jgi:hypothetical protein
MDNLTFTEQQRAKEKNYSQVRKKNSDEASIPLRMVVFKNTS